MSSRSQVPVVNLKERIAALEQKNGVQNQHHRPTSPALVSPANLGPPTSQRALKERIAKFESKGGVPVPRGSFGLGAPPPSESNQTKRRGELYGNRIPAPLRPQVTGGELYGNRVPAPLRPQVTGGSIGTGFTQSRSVSPMQFPRQASLSGVDFDNYADTSPPESVVGSPRLESSFRSLSPPPPLPDGLTEDLPKLVDTGKRGTAFATALDIARKAEAESQAVYDPRSRENSMSPSPPPIVANRRFSSFFESTPSPVIVVSEEVNEGPAKVEDERADAAAVPNEPELVAEGESSAEVIIPSEAKQDFPSPSESDPPVVSASVEPSSAEQSNHLESPPLSPPVSSEISPESRTEDTAYSTDDSVEPPAVVAAFIELVSGPLADSNTDAALPVEPQHVISPSSEQDTANQGDEAGTSCHDILVQHDTDLPSEALKSEDDGRDLRPAEAASVDDPETPERRGPVVDETSQVVGEQFDHDCQTDVKESSSDAVSVLTTPAYDSFPQAPSPISPTSPLAHLAYDEPEPEPENQIKPSLESSAAQVEPSSPIEEASFASTSPRESFISQTITMSSRPISMVESSPGHLETAHRISPLTSRGIPIFIPPSRPLDVPASSTTPVTTNSLTTPVPPPVSLQSPVETEFGMVTLGHSQSKSKSYSHPSQPLALHYTEPDFNPAHATGSKSNTFSAVVHGKVRDVPAYNATLPRVGKNVLPSTPQRSRLTGGDVMFAEPPMSPPSGDLTMLLQQATLLEKRLMDGELPSEVLREQMGSPGPKTAPADVREHSRQPSKERREQQFQHARERANSTKSGKERVSEETSRKHRLSIRNPLGRSKSANQKDAVVKLNSGSTPHLPEKNVGRAKSMYFASSSQPSLSVPPLPSVQEPMEPVPPVPSLTASVTDTDDVPPTPPPKSPRKYLSGFKRLASSSRSHGAYPRHSVSTSSEISSEDSVAVVTPPDNSPDFVSSGTLLETRTRTRSGSRSGAFVVGMGVPWPGGSPKKNGGGMSRAASFAEKMWQRRRTRSGASIASSVDSNDRLAVQSVFEPLPSIPSAVFPPEPPVHVIPSIEEPEIYAPFDLPSRAPSLDAAAPPKHNSIPNTPPRPVSWVSTSSAGSTPPTPLFDKELFDAFPSVPQTMPSLTRELSLAGHSRTSSQATLSLPSRHLPAVVGPGHPHTDGPTAAAAPPPVAIARHVTKRSFKTSAPLNHKSEETPRQVSAVP